MAAKSKGKALTAKRAKNAKSGEKSKKDHTGVSGGSAQTEPSAHQMKEMTNALVISYKFLRVTVGALGMGMPLILYAGGRLIFGDLVQPSLSAYYHTSMRDVLVGILFALGVFLFSYKGYGRPDDIAGNLACLFAIGTALFPTLPLEGPITPIDERNNIIHHIFATGFLLTLTYFALFLFTKSDKPASEQSPGKRMRNTVYRLCGGLMTLSILVIGAYFLLQGGVGPFLGSSVPIYWLETVAIFAFGVSWFVKSGYFIKDDEEETPLAWVAQFAP
jgi:hypothetical protein